MQDQIRSFTIRKLTYLSTLALMFVIPWEDSISIPSLGSLAKLIGLVVAGLWLGTVLIEGKFRKPSPFHLFVLLFFLWNFVSVFWSLDIESTIQRIKTYSQIFLLMFICWDIFQMREDLIVGLQAYVFGAYVLIISTIYNYRAGHVAVQYEGRYSATGVNAVDVALILILGLPIAWSMAMQVFFVAGRTKKETLLQVINLIYIPLSVFSIILTGSRTSLVAIMPFAIFMIGTRWIKTERKVLIFVILCIFLLALFPFIPQSVINRLGTIGASIGASDLGGRVNLWWEGIASLAQHPVLGVGSGAINRIIGGAIHNTFISVITDTGFIGFILFLSILGLVIYKVTRMPRRVSQLWLTIFITWAIGVLSLSWEFRKITWILLSFMIIESSFKEHLVEKAEDINFSGSFKWSLESDESVHQPRWS